MSDDFATCMNCGCENGDTQSVEYLFELIADELYLYVDKDTKFNGEDSEDVQFLVSKAKEILELEKHMKNNERKCLECGEWSTFSWRHVEYGGDD